MNYLITGSGYLAKHLIARLLKDENTTKIKVFSRSEKNQWETKMLFIISQTVLSIVPQYLNPSDIIPAHIE